MRTPQGRRLFTFLRGRNAERLALLLLMVKGYRPVARRFAAAGGEIDLIVRRGRTLAFVEVKVRAELDRAQIAIDAGKRRRISRAARVWMARNPWSSAMILRPTPSFSRPAPGRSISSAPSRSRPDFTLGNCGETR